MDKRVIFAVAGSGKTTLLIRRLSEDRRTLLLTFTVNNEAHLRAQIIRRFGFIPEGIRVMTWFEFLHGFCFRPFLQEQLASRGLSFDQPPPRIPRTNARHYQDPAGRLYHRRLAHLLTARGLLPDIRIRLARYYDGHCCKVSDEAAFCLIQRPYISKTLLTRRISPRGSP